MCHAWEWSILNSSGATSCYVANEAALSGSPLALAEPVFFGKIADKLSARFVSAFLSCQHLQHRAEFKAGSIAVHWRSLSDWEAEELRDRVLAGWNLITEHSGLELLEFDGGVEIRVPGVDEGNVVRLVLSEMEDGNLGKVCARYGTVSRLLPNSGSWIPGCHFAKKKAMENHRVGEPQLKTTV
jgi:hypothetical protein